jgi:hypothetical protein
MAKARQTGNSTCHRRQPGRARGSSMEGRVAVAFASIGFQYLSKEKGPKEKKIP